MKRHDKQGDGLVAIPSKIEKVYKVRDPIYGFVKLDAQEMDIVNSKYYQRLRRIKQLSLTVWFIRVQHTPDLNIRSVLFRWHLICLIVS